MTIPALTLPDDLPSCHAMIVQLEAECDAAKKQIEALQVTAHHSAAHSARLDGLVLEYEERIADLQRTIDNLAADNASLKRCVFGSRRERFIDDPSQELLFVAMTTDASAPVPEAVQE